MKPTHRSSSQRSLRLISLFLCYSLLHPALPMLASGRGRPASLLAHLTQDGPAPRSGAPEGSFPNLDEAKSRQPAPPRAPDSVPSTKRSKRNPPNPRTAPLIGPPRPAPSPTPPRIRLPVQIPVPSPNLRTPTTTTVRPTDHFDANVTARNGGLRPTLINNLIAYNFMVPTFSLNGGGQIVDGLLATVFSELVTPDASKNLAAFAFLPQPQGGSPYGGNSASIPGIVESEHFDNGGEGLGYHETSSGSHGQDYDQPGYPPPSFRQPTDVDIYKAAADYSKAASLRSGLPTCGRRTIHRLTTLPIRA